MKLFQSYVTEHQRSFLSQAAIPFDASENIYSNQREYELFKKIKLRHPGIDNEPWGMVSWKFNAKCLVSPEEFMEFAASQFDKGCDCVFINPMIGHEALYANVWEQGQDSGHAGLEKIATFLQSKLGDRVTAPMGKEVFTLCNYFIATNVFWNQYFSFVDEALSLLDHEIIAGSEVGIIYGGSANYTRDKNVSMRPFVIERLFSSFIAGSSLKCVSYEYCDHKFQAKFGNVLGSFLYKLLKVKHFAIETMDGNQLERYEEVRQSILRTDYKTAIWQLDDPFDYFLSRDFINAAIV